MTVLALTLLGQGTVAWGKSGAVEGTAEQIASGTGAVLGSAIYFPPKQ